MHNNTNVLAFGSRVVGSELAKMIVKSWLDAKYIGGRHERRVEELTAIEDDNKQRFTELEHSTSFDGKEKFEDQPL